MTPEEFDIDFDFDKAYGYGSGSGKSGTDADDFDLDAILERELGPDFDALFEKEFAASQAALREEAQPKPAPAEPEEDLSQTRFFPDFGSFDEEPEEQEEQEELENDFFEAVEAGIEEAESTEGEPEDFFIPPAAAAAAGFAAGADEYPEDDEDEEEAPQTHCTPRQKPKMPDLRAMADKIDLSGVKAGLQNAFAGMGHVITENGSRFVSGVKECWAPGRKMTGKQKRRFKEDVLPVLIGGAAFILCLIFICGSLSRAINSEDRQMAALQESMAQAELEAAAAAEIQKVLDTAAVQAAGYDYQAAIATLDSYKDDATGRELTDEMAAARAEYSAAMTNLVVWDDPTAIPNLSFHVLIADSQRAYADEVYGSSYREKFITTARFTELLEDLHRNGYVLVNLESCIAEKTDASGSTTYDKKPIFLPEGKKPIMITETLVNYFSYMIDGNGDGVADADGAGFASRLVISGGEIKAEYVDANGDTHVGDYDLVPILNSFINDHPDFTYHGAKAILAVTGSEGVFGWRTEGDEKAADTVRDIAEILRADGYQIASNSYANLDYSGKTSVEDINVDLNHWHDKITPILGEVDIMIIAKGSGIRTRGGGFKAMEAAGFHYILDSTETPGAELNAEYFHQHRVMVTEQALSSGALDDYFTIAG